MTKLTRNTLSTCIIISLVSTTLLAGEPTAVIDSTLYDFYVQNDVPAPVTLMPRAGVPDEDVYQYRAAAPQEAAIEEGATRYLETDFLLNRGIETYGFIDIGIGANAWGADWNGPITFNDRAWQGQMNQLYLINELILKEDRLSLGGRVDLLYGTDYIYTTATGFDGGWNDTNGGCYYGLAMPQLYGEIGTQALNVKFGHFYTLIGYKLCQQSGTSSTPMHTPCSMVNHLLTPAYSQHGIQTISCRSLVVSPMGGTTGTLACQQTRRTLSLEVQAMHRSWERLHSQVQMVRKPLQWPTRVGMNLLQRVS